MSYPVAILSHGFILPAGEGLPAGYVEPAEGDVRAGTAYGTSGTAYTGTLVVPSTAPNGLYPHRVNIEAVTRTSDSMGNHTEAWATSTASVPCAVRSMSVEERDRYQALEYVPTHRVYMGDVTITEETHRINWNGLILRVLGVQKKHNLITGLVHHLEIDAYAGPEDN